MMRYVYDAPAKDLREQIARIVFEMSETEMGVCEDIAASVMAHPDIANAFEAKRRWDKSCMDALDD